MSTRVSWRCECGKNLNADRSASGFPFICPKCGKKARVPKQGPARPKPVDSSYSGSIGPNAQGELSIERPAPRIEQLHPAAEKFEVEDEVELIDEPPKVVSGPSKTTIPPAVASAPPNSIVPRYASLRRASRWIRIYGWVILAIGAVWTILALAIVVNGLIRFRPGFFESCTALLMSIVPLGLAVLSWTFTLAMAEMIMVQIDSEENTRMTCLLLHRMNDQQKRGE